MGIQRLSSALVKYGTTSLLSFLNSLPLADSDMALKPKDFGAKGNGTDDDTDAIQRCVDAAAATGKRVLVAGGSVHLIRGLTVKAGVVIFGDGKGMFKKANNVAGDFISLQDGAAMVKVRVHGNKENQTLEAASALVRIGSSNDTKLLDCNISYANSYAVVINDGSRAVVQGNTLRDYYQQGIAVYSSLGKRDHVICDNSFYDIGWGAISMSYVQFAEVKRNKAYGFVIGHRSKRLFVDTNGTHVQVRAGDSFKGLRAGNFLVLDGGKEYRILNIINDYECTIDRPTDGNYQGYAALAGAGDLIGIQSCWNVDCDDNYLTGTTTYGFGGGTMQGNTEGMYYCNFRRNTVELAGKNGFNLTQAGHQPVGSCFVMDNRLRQVGMGGDAVASFDKHGIGLHFGDSGYMADIVLDRNSVESYSGDNGQTECWLGITGTPLAGSVLIGQNFAIGTKHPYVMGDVITIATDGWGSESKWTAYTSYGNSCSVTVSSAGSGQLPNPSVTVTKACVPMRSNLVMAHIATSTIGVYPVWGTANSTVGVWKFFISGTPQPNGTIEFYVTGLL